ncbi:MAG: hypothetical protein WD894_02915 [Pirellulales bacterium]
MANFMPGRRKVFTDPPPGLRMRQTIDRQAQVEERIGIDALLGNVIVQQLPTASAAAAQPTQRLLTMTAGDHREPGWEGRVGWYTIYRPFE